MTRQADPVVLVVDDDRELADLFTRWLADRYSVKTAYSGAEGLELLDESVDVVLLDRRMPDMTGDTVLENAREQDLECRIALVTAIEPDFDILEMGFDEYLVKPVSCDELQDVVEVLLRRKTYATSVQRYYELAVKRAMLIDQKGPQEVEDHPQYQALQAELAALDDELHRRADNLDATDIEAQFRNLSK